jgi:hypothetical protein
LKSHRQFVTILILFVAFRAGAILVFRPGGYLGDLSDFGYYRLLLSFTNQGFYPLIHFWVEYPPVFPWILVGLYRLSLLIPAWPQAGTWFYLLLSAFLTAVEAGNLILIYALARRLHGAEPAVRLAWVYSALLIPVLTLLGGFDGLVLLFLLAAVWLTLSQRPVASGVAVGLGFMTKLVPIAAVPAALKHLHRRSDRVGLLVAAGLTVLAIALPFLLTGPDFFIQSFRSSAVRASWETVWALIDGYYSYGVAGGFDRFDPAMAGARQHPSNLPWPAITAAFSLLFLVLYTRRADWSDNRRVVAFTALTLNLMVLYFRGYSPQFLVMLLPFIILVVPGRRAVAYALLLTVVNLAEYPIYFLVLPDQHWLLTGTVLLRTCVLVVVSLEYAGQVYAWRIRQQSWKRLCAAVTGLVMICGVGGAIAGLAAYSERSYDASPHRPALELLAERAAPGPSVLVGDQNTFEQLFPFLHRRFRLVVVETHSYLPPWEPRLGQAAGDSEDDLWVYAPADSALLGWLAGHYPRLAIYDFQGWQLSEWDTK